MAVKTALCSLIEVIQQGEEHSREEKFHRSISNAFHRNVQAK
jgi:hypothetical protein